MRELAKPYWILLTVTMPQAVLLFLYASSYLVIRTLMEKEYIFNWKLYGSLLVLLLCASTLYAGVRWIRRKKIDALFGVFIFLTYLPLLYFFLMNNDRIIPFNVPRWMFERDDLVLYAFTFLMPAFAHGLVLLVLRLTPEEKDHPVKGTILGAILIPAFWYVCLNVVIPMLKSLFGKTFMNFVDKKFMVHVLLILVISSTIAFLFFAVRLTYLVLLKKPLAAYRRAYLYKFFFLVVMPLLCFGVYNGLLFGGKRFSGVFGFLGDLSSSWYYITAALTGILLMLPAFASRGVRLALFLAKSITSSFVFYFFLVLLPFLPLAIPAIIAAGFGFLMLMPLVVMVVHTQSLTTDYQFLKVYYGRGSVIAVFLIGFLILPLGITGNFLHDRITMNKMLDFVYSPDFSVDTPGIDRSAAKRTLSTIRTNKHAAATFMPDRKPYITPFYHWLVLDNMTLSNSKLQVLERIFWGASDVRVPKTAEDIAPGTRPVVVSIKTEAGPSENSGYSRTWVHVEIRNNSTQQQEYVTRFRLPVGAWIEDYYLKIGDERIRGILTDKKSATWVYQQITSEKKDPGILYYTENDEIMFRVFPLVAGETRSAGFELIHRGPVTLEIDRHQVALRGREQEETVTALNGNVVFIPEIVKKKLPRTVRKPYYHFILDCSIDTQRAKEGYITRIRKLLDRKPADGFAARITLTNYQTSTFDLKDGWEHTVRQFPSEGGFYLERAMKNILVRNYQERAHNYPVFVVVSDNPANAIFVEGMGGFLSLLPENNSYYEFDVNGGLNSRSLSGPQGVRNARHRDRTVHHVLAWPDEKNPLAFLPDDNQASIVLLPDPDISPVDLNGTSWENGLALEGMWMYLRRYPSKSGSMRLPFINNSFRTSILTPLTSFIALENEAQRQALLRKQERVLSANKSLDIGEEREMSEPPLYILLLLMLLVMAFKVGIFRRKAGGMR